MHELSVTQSVVDAVVERTGDQRVIEVRREVGRLCGVVPEAMRFCFGLVTDGTPLEGAGSTSTSRQAAPRAGDAARFSPWPTWSCYVPAAAPTSRC